MKLFKRISALFLCAVILTGCGDREGMDLSILIPPEEEDPYPHFTRACFIYSGSVSDGRNPMIESFELARINLERVLGIETVYIENVLVQQFPDAVDAAIADGANLIISACSRFSSAAVLAAKSNINTRFVSFGGSDQSYNLASVQPLLFQPAFINGFTAAFNTNTNKIGIVADVNMYNAYGIINAFALGVRELPHSKIDIYLNWARSGNLSNTSDAINDLIEQGCDIIFVYQADNYAVKRLNDLGVKTIGFAYNLPELAPDTYLTGFFLNLNTYFIEKARGIMYNSFRGDLTRGGLSHQRARLIMLNDELVYEGTRVLTDAMIDFVSEDMAPVFSGEIRDTDDYVRVRKGEYMLTDQIFRIDWLMNTIVRERNFSTQLTEADLIFSDLVIRS